MPAGEEEEATPLAAEGTPSGVEGTRSAGTGDIGAATGGEAATVGAAGMAGEGVMAFTARGAGEAWA